MKHPLIILFRSMLVLLWFFPWEMLQARDIRTHSPEELAELHYDQLIDIGDDVNSLAWDTDSIRENVSSIHNEVRTLTNDVSTYVNDNTGCCNWNMIGAIGSMLSIIVMLVVYCLTRIQTRKQIESHKEDTNKQLEAQKKSTQEQITAQSENTKNHIDEQRRLSSEQISEMQEQALSRAQALEKMGKIIETHTGNIQKTVKHFEDKYLANNDRVNIENALSEMTEYYDRISKKMENDYYHFDNDSNNSKPNMDLYEECYTKIKRNTETIRDTLSKHPDTIKKPDATPYIEALNEVVFKPSFLDMDKQRREFIQKGKEYHNEVRSVILSLFNENQ